MSQCLCIRTKEENSSPRVLLPLESVHSLKPHPKRPESEAQEGPRNLCKSQILRVIPDDADACPVQEVLLWCADVEGPVNHFYSADFSQLRVALIFFTQYKMVVHIIICLR